MTSIWNAHPGEPWATSHGSFGLGWVVGQKQWEEAVQGVFGG